LVLVVLVQIYRTQAQLKALPLFLVILLVPSNLLEVVEEGAKQREMTLVEMEDQEVVVLLARLLDLQEALVIRLLFHLHRAMMEVADQFCRLR
jgi:hypothetical protein